MPRTPDWAAICDDATKAAGGLSRASDFAAGAEQTLMKSGTNAANLEIASHQLDAALIAASEGLLALEDARNKLTAAIGQAR